LSPTRLARSAWSSEARSLAQRNSSGLTLTFMGIILRVDGDGGRFSYVDLACHGDRAKVCKVIKMRKVIQAIMVFKGGAGG
jgi:hypothetical protein